MKKNEAKNQDRNRKQPKEDIERETHAEWVEKTKAKAKLMIELACKQFEEQQAARAEKFGRWAPVIDALEEVAHVVFEVAEDAVSNEPRQLAKVQRARDLVIARLCRDKAPMAGIASMADVMYAAGLLAQLVDDELNLGIAVVPDTLMATLATREIRDALSDAFARI